MDYLIVVVLVCFSAFFSGLTLGFFSLNKGDLERKAALGDKQAKLIYSVRRNGNFLLCTLLIGNVAVNSALSIYLGSIVSGIVAGVIATALIVVFGEIVPQSVFSRYALILGAKMVWPVRLAMLIFLPATYPLAWALDKILGDEMPTVYSKQELMKIIEDHEDLKESDLDEDEERIIRGALSFSDKTVEAVMTPRTQMYSLPEDQPLTRRQIQEISDRGHSRIPVYKGDRDQIVGILYVKDLLKIDCKGKTAGGAARKDVIFVDAKKHLDSVLDDFKKSRHHMFVVLSEFGGVQGIITIEDVLEEIIGEEIVDEFDRYEDLQAQARKMMRMKKINTI